MEEYRVSDMESELQLSQEAMVRMALLLGSDYTEGVPGIGIVNALEVVRLGLLCALRNRGAGMVWGSS